MQRDLFDEPRAKLARARKHLAELLAAERQFSATKPMDVHVGTGMDGNPAILMTARTFPSLEASAIAGDVLNNLRAASDLSISAACRADGKTSLSKTYFAMASSEQQWDECTKGKHDRMKAANPRIKALARTFRPWDGGNQSLYALSKLVGVDKHQALLAMAVHQGGMTLDGLSVKNAAGGLVRMNGNAYPRVTPDEPTAEIMNFDAGTTVSLAGPHSVKAIFAFEAVDRLPYAGAARLLNDMLSITANIVETFSTASHEGKLT